MKEQTRALLCDEKYNFKNRCAFQEKKINLFEYGFLQGLYTGKDQLAVKSNGCKPAVIRILNSRNHSRMFGVSAVSGSSVKERTVGGSVKEHTVGRSDPCCYAIHIPVPPFFSCQCSAIFLGKHNPIRKGKFARESTL